MALHIQLDLFEPCTEEFLFRGEVASLAKSHNALRKATFAKFSEVERNLSREVIRLNDRIEALERQLLMVAKTK